MNDDAPMLADAIDWRTVHRLALEGVALLAQHEPGVARRMRRAVERGGGAAIHVARWADGEAAIAVAGIEVWRGPLARLVRRGPVS